MKSLILFDKIYNRICGCMLSTEQQTKNRLKQYADCDNSDRYIICEIDGDWRDYSEYYIYKECNKQVCK